MRAIVLPKFGGPELFELREVEKPKPGPGEVLVRVIASGTNPMDAKLRADGSWANLEPPVILGYDAAGIIEEIGPGVEDLQVADEVFYTPVIFWNQAGTYAEYNVVRASIVARKPRGLSFIEAAAIPLAGGAAWEAVIRRLRPVPGETVLIHGGSGGVGAFAVQFARVAGARVLATASAGNLEFLRKIGADVAIDYQSNVAKAVERETDGAGADAAFDIEGPNRVSRTLPMVRPNGRIACVQPPEGDLAALSSKNIALHGISLTRERKRLEEMTPLFERGRVRAIVDEILPLEDVAKAHERLDSGHGRGKIVLQVAQAPAAVGDIEKEEEEEAEEETEKTA
jgi:NADPH2:quinone reductase